jgi:site-specific recombinase XerD
VEALMAQRVATPAAANKLRKLIKRLMRFAMRRRMGHRDPTVGVKQLKENPDGFYTWSDKDIEAFEAYHPLGSKAHLALHLMLGTGAARADVIKLGWANIRDKEEYFLPARRPARR